MQVISTVSGTNDDTIVDTNPITPANASVNATVIPIVITKANSVRPDRYRRRFSSTMNRPNSGMKSRVERCVSADRYRSTNGPPILRTAARGAGASTNGAIAWSTAASATWSSSRFWTASSMGMPSTPSPTSPCFRNSCVPVANALKAAAWSGVGENSGWTWR